MHCECIMNEQWMDGWMDKQMDERMNETSARTVRTPKGGAILMRTGSRVACPENERGEKRLQLKLLSFSLLHSTLLLLPASPCPTFTNAQDTDHWALKTRCISQPQGHRGKDLGPDHFICPKSRMRTHATPAPPHSPELFNGSLCHPQSSDSTERGVPAQRNEDSQPGQPDARGVTRTFTAM